jgi:hypothetical protein
LFGAVGSEIGKMIMGTAKTASAAAALTAILTTILPSFAAAQAITTTTLAVPPLGFYDSVPNGIVMHVSSDSLSNSLVSEIQPDGTIYRYFNNGHGHPWWSHIDPRSPEPHRWARVGPPQYFTYDQKRYNPYQHLHDKLR